MGDYHFGIRASTPELLQALRELFAAHLVEDDSAPSNYSLQLPAGNDFGFLYRSSLADVRTRSSRRLVEALLSHLGFFADEAAGGLVAVDAMPLVSVAGASLVPWELRPSLANIERSLNRAGYAVADERYALLDPARRELVVGRPLSGLDSNALARAGALGPTTRRPEDTVAPGRYPLRGWVFAGAEDAVAPADAVALAARLSRNSMAIGAQQALDGLVTVLQATPATGMRAWHRDALLQALGRVSA